MESSLTPVFPATAFYPTSGPRASVCYPLPRPTHRLRRSLFAFLTDLAMDETALSLATVRSKRSPSARRSLVRSKPKAETPPSFRPKIFTVFPQWTPSLRPSVKPLPKTGAALRPDQLPKISPIVSRNARTLTAPSLSFSRTYPPKCRLPDSSATRSSSAKPCSTPWSLGFAYRRLSPNQKRLRSPLERRSQSAYRRNFHP